MANSQPANATISIFRRLRVVRDNRRHTSVKHLTTPFDTNYVPVPGEEVQVLENRDASFRTDAFRYGHPVTVEPRANCTLADIYAGIAGLDFPVRLPGNFREMQVQLVPGHVTDDLYGEAQAVCAGHAFVV